MSGAFWAAILSLPPSGPQTIVSDAFNRANNASALGVADSGQTWTTLDGTHGIIANQAYAATAAADNQGSSYIDAGRADVTIQATFAVNNDRGPRLIWRLSDVNDYFLLQQESGTGYVAYRLQGAGLFTSIGSTSGVTPSNGDVVTVILSGNAFAVQINGTTRITGTDSFNATATKHGIGFGSTDASTGRIDNFTVTVP